MGRALDSSVLNSGLTKRKERALLSSLFLRLTPVLDGDRRKCRSGMKGKRRDYGSVKSVKHAFRDPDHLEGLGSHGNHGPEIIFSPGESTAGFVVFTRANLEEGLPGF